MVRLQRPRGAPQQTVKPSDTGLWDRRGLGAKRDSEKCDAIDLETRRSALGEKGSAGQMLERAFKRGNEPVPGWVPGQRVA